MLIFEPWKKALIALILVFGFFATLPNFFYSSVQTANEARDRVEALTRAGETPPADLAEKASLWPSWLPSGLVNLGLDLQGGSHFLLEVQLEEVVKERLELVAQQIRQVLRDAGVTRRSTPEIAGDAVTVRIPLENERDAARTALATISQPIGDALLGLTGQDFEVVDVGDGVFRLELTDQGRDQLADTTLRSAIEVIRTRVDALGTKEPNIVREGVNRILLQLPGETDVNIDEITKPARLEFRMVVEGANLDNPPPGVEVFAFDADVNPDREGERIAVRSQIEIRGDQLAEASQGFDQDGVVGVNLRFDAAASRRFGELSRNTGSRFAMILDGQVLSAPVFREYIPSGVAIITGEFSIQSAKALAVNLSSGSLPAELTVEERSVIGPELGKDSIEAGAWACIIGFMLVLVYMALSYGFFGLMANVALILNVMLIFGALSLLGATLTLPGIAGIVLTIGMAVDANVLVFERIREELRRGRNVARAIETGYSQALSAIIDANITTFIAAMVLFAIGSGPVRGFSVTLAIGIVTSVFTAVMLTRFFVASWYGWRRPKELAL